MIFDLRIEINPGIIRRILYICFALFSNRVIISPSPSNRNLFGSRSAACISSLLFVRNLLSITLRRTFIKSLYSDIRINSRLAGSRGVLFEIRVPFFTVWISVESRIIFSVTCFIYFLLRVFL